MSITSERAEAELRRGKVADPLAVSLRAAVGVIMPRRLVVAAAAVAALMARGAGASGARALLEGDFVSNWSVLSRSANASTNVSVSGHAPNNPTPPPSPSLSHSTGAATDTAKAMAAAMGA